MIKFPKGCKPASGWENPLIQYHPHLLHSHQSAKPLEIAFAFVLAPRLIQVAPVTGFAKIEQLALLHLTRFCLA
jgi:hypothetical protein